MLLAPTLEKVLERLRETARTYGVRIDLSGIAECLVRRLLPSVGLWWRSSDHC